MRARTTPPPRSPRALDSSRITSDQARRVTRDVSRALVEIDGQVRKVALDHQAGSDVNVLAYAIHNLISVVEKLRRSL